MLDLYLSLGYFRMYQDLFTYRYIVINETIHPVHWLRIDLLNVEYKAKQRSLLRRNEHFTVVAKPFRLNAEIETLYALYRGSIDFDAPESVESWLQNGALYNVFDTQSIEVRDGDRLIAVGIFDNGARSIAGIMNFYHPAYRKHSLGKYLMLQKINYARSQQKLFYYPGYLVSNYPKFDYKLFPCEEATEVLDDSNDLWLPFSWETVSALAADILNET